MPQSFVRLFLRRPYGSKSQQSQSAALPQRVYYSCTINGHRYNGKTLLFVSPAGNTYRQFQPQFKPETPADMITAERLKHWQWCINKAAAEVIACGHEITGRSFQQRVLAYHYQAVRQPNNPQLPGICYVDEELKVLV